MSVLLVGISQFVFAVEDTNTPGDDHWEININASGIHASDRWDIVAPEVEVNYGWGGHLQLMANIPWVIVHETGQHAKSGWGPGTVGIKWRFIDQEAAAFSMAIFPQYTWNFLSSSVRRGLIAPGKQLYLPLMIGREIDEFEVFAEVGRRFVEEGLDEWVAGLRVAYQCTKSVECLVDVQKTAIHQERQMLANLGIKWKLSDSLILKTFVGHERDSGDNTVDQHKLLLHFGLQILY